MKVVVVLNGTDHVPGHQWGLDGNPFPAIPDASPRFHAANALLHDLDAHPIRDVGDLVGRLAGCSDEFIKGCCQRYVPGRRVRFVIEFPDPTDYDPSEEDDT